MSDETRSRHAEVAALAAMGLGQAAVAMVRVTASYKALELGASVFGVGVVGGAFAALSLVAALPLGIGIDRRGHMPFLVGGLLLLLLAPLVQLGAGAIWALVIGQALLGLGQTAQAVSIQTQAANASSARQSSDERFAQVSTAAGAGQFVGPMLAGYALGWGTQSISGTSVSYALACIAAVGGLVAALVLRSTGQAKRTRGADTARVGTLAMLRRGELRGALVASVIVLTTLDILIAYLPVLGQERGIPPHFIGILLSLQAGSSLVFRLVLPRFLRLLGRQRTLAITLAVSGVSMIGIVVPAHPWVLVAMMLLLGFGLGAGQPLSMAWTAQSVGVNDRGAALAMRVAANRLGQLLVPSMLGALAVSLGSGIVFGSGAAVLIAGSTWLGRAWRHGR
jgi:MFS family permease